MNYLTKSDFLISLDCNTKLYYKKNNYTNTVFEDEFTSLLAEGGLLVEYYARMLFEDGKLVDYGSNESNIVMTKKLLSENDEITLFNPVFRYEKCLSKSDIIVKKGNEIYLYDVHSVSFNGENEQLQNKNGTIKSNRKSLIYDTAFQVRILRNIFPEHKIIPILTVLDKTKKSKYDNLLNNFNFSKIKEDEVEGNRVPIIEFTGLKKEIVIDNDLFVYKDITILVDAVSDYVDIKCKELSNFITPNEIKKPKCALSKICKNCEFSKGKEECWSHMPKHDNSIFDIVNSTMQKLDSVNVMDQLITERKTNITNWPIDDLKEGKTVKRQRIQIENTLSNTEWIDDRMLDQIDGFKYPLHFIDFETTRPAIPHNKDDKPYEQLAFQWSCHTIPYPGADAIHKEWISFEKGFPNFKFAEALKDHIKSKGTVFMWHHHERTVLKDILKQINEREYDNPALEKWLENITTNDRMVDMHVMAKEYYFHPTMKGRTSIKKVLPAVWNNSESIQMDYSINQLFPDLTISDPYLILEGREDLKCKQFDKVNVGTDAIVAYQQMMRDLYMGDHINARNIKNMLLEYCKLDTFAMYIIYYHWYNLLVDRQELISNIEKICSSNLKTKNYYTIVRTKDLYTGIKFKSFRDVKDCELRMIHFDGEKLEFDFYYTNNSNSRINKIFDISCIDTFLLDKIYSILDTDTYNDIYINYYNERKELHSKIDNHNTLTDDESDRLRFLNDELQKIIDNE